MASANCTTIGQRMKIHSCASFYHRADFLQGNRKQKERLSDFTHFWFADYTSGVCMFIVKNSILLRSSQKYHTISLCHHS